MTDPNSAAALEELIARYNDAWNAHDVDAIVDLHAPRMVFENHTAGERAEGDDVREHIATIFQNWPDLTFSSRRLYARDGLVVSEWTADCNPPGDGRAARVGRRGRLSLRERQDRAQGRVLRGPPRARALRLASAHDRALR